MLASQSCCFVALARLVVLWLASGGPAGAAAVRAPAGSAARARRQASAPDAALRQNVTHSPAGGGNISVQAHVINSSHTVGLLTKVGRLSQHRDLPDVAGLEVDAQAPSSSQDAAASALDGATEDEALAAVREAEAQQASVNQFDLRHRATADRAEQAPASDEGQGATKAASDGGGKKQDASDDATDAPEEERSAEAASGGSSDEEDQDETDSKARDDKDSKDEKGGEDEKDSKGDKDSGDEKDSKGDKSVEEEKDGDQADESKDDESADEGEETGDKAGKDAAGKAAESEAAEEKTKEGGKGEGGSEKDGMSESSLDEEIEKQLDEDKKVAPREESVGDGEDAEALSEDRLRKRRVGDLQGSIANETGSRGLAQMLADIKMDMFGLRDKVGDLEKTIQAGVRLEAVPADEQLVFPLSTCMRCILTLTGLYFLTYTAAGVSKVFAGAFSLGENTKTELSLRAACDTVFFAPMLCVLFMGAHLRAMQISEGKSGPGEATELAMQACTWSVILQAMLVLLIPVLTGEVVRVDEETGLELPDIQDTVLAGIMTLVRYAAMAGLYLSVAVICAQVVLMDTHTLGVRPVDRWDDSTTAITEYAPPVSAAMLCTMCLTGLFFAVHLFRSVLRSCLEFSDGGMHGASREGHRSGARELIAHWEQCLQVCAHATSPAPMLCILFMAARMRALQLDAKTGRPQSWAEMCFYESAAAIAVHTAVIFLAKAFGVSAGAGPRAAGEPSSSEASAEGAMLWAERFVFVTRVLSVFVVCGGFLGVISSMLLIKAPEGGLAPPAPPAMLCVFAFAGMYFTVYVSIFLSQAFALTSFSLGVASEGSAYLFRTVNVLQVAECSAKLCPMLSVLFIGACMRAQLLSGPKGSVQCWAQDAMCVAAAALLAQLLLALAAGSPSAAAAPPTGPGEKPRRSSWAEALDVAKALSFVVLYGSVAVVGFSVLVIGPETAVCKA